MPITQLKALFKTERKTISLLILWTSLHIFLWSIGANTRGIHAEGNGMIFYPFAGSFSPVYGLVFYDFSEFFFYGVLPWIGFGTYQFWSIACD